MYARIVAACIVLTSLICASAPTSAQERKAGDRIAYTLHMTGQGGGMGSGSGMGMDGKITLALDRIDTDGSAHASVTVDSGQMTAMSKSPFEATLSPKGEIVIATDANALRPKMQMSKAEGKAMAAQGVALMVSMNLHAFNAFAAACGARKNLRVGDSWHGMTDGADVTYKVAGREQHLGHDAFLIRMEPAPGAGVNLSGLGYYDASAHLVVSIHTESKMPGSPETQINDIALAS